MVTLTPEASYYCLADISTSNRSEVIPTSPGKLTQAEGNATSSDVRARARRRACSIRAEKLSVAGRHGEGGAVRYRSSKGAPRTKHQGRGLPPSIAAQSLMESSKRTRSKGKEAGQASQTPPGSRHCFKIPGAGPWVRGFHVCAGQLGSDRAIAHVLLHRAIFLTSSINHLAWARDASGPWGEGKGLGVV